MMKPRRATCCTILAAGLLSASVQARPGLCLDRPIRVAYYESGLFFRQGLGVDADVVKELRRRSSCAFEEQALPRARAYLMLEQGQLDMMIAAIENPARTHYAYYIPYLQQRFVTLVLRTVPEEKTSMTAFTADQTLSFGVVRGVNYGAPRDQWLQTLVKAGRVQIAPSPAIAYRMLQGKRFNALFATPLQYERELDELGMRAQVRIVNWFPGQPPTLRHLALSRANFSAAQLDQWSAIVGKMRKDGTMQSILERYLTPADAAEAIPR